MSFESCEKLVKAGDPDRFLSAQSAPPEARNALMAIYAVNLEIARAPWASPEPLVAQIRLQWWADEIGKIYHGKRVNSHEILPALREVIFDHTLPREVFENLIEARHADLDSTPIAGRAGFDSYIKNTSGSVMALASKVLGATPEHMPIINDFAYGAGVAAMLRAAPELQARRRSPLPENLSDVVTEAQNCIAKARRLRRHIPPALAPALLAGWRADATLNHARKHPEDIMRGGLEESPARKMATLRWRRLVGRW
ncbi:MAG: squalene/phytoene synthase family protein [Rhodobacteraceae bacterium]|nr:squalene/phytoene synthase family protein [Paracoccaceae bacterium]